MPRRRSLDPTKAINITLPVSLLAKIHNQISRTQSRSAWIAGAIRMRLGESGSLGEVRTRSLFIELMLRDDVDDDLKKIIELRLTSSSSLDDEQDA